MLPTGYLQWCQAVSSHLNQRNQPKALSIEKSPGAAIGAWRFVSFTLHGDLTCKEVLLILKEKLQPRICFDDIHTVNLLALPLLGLRIKGGVDEDLPVLIITGRIV